MKYMCMPKPKALGIVIVIVIWACDEGSETTLGLLAAALDCFYKLPEVTVNKMQIS